MTKAPLTVAIDGPAGSGKSSVSRAAADRLGYGILDTGAVYRALAWAALRSGIDLDDPVAMLELAETWQVSTTLRGRQRVTVRIPAVDLAQLSDEIDVTTEIREPRISAEVSRVSKHPAVRDALNGRFRRIVAESQLPGVVIEGRDITTVVAPEAPVRLILTASPEVRAARRAGELPGLTPEQVLADLTARDAKDALVVDFFNPAPGVLLVDTSDLNFDESVQAVIDIVREAESSAPNLENPNDTA